MMTAPVLHIGAVITCPHGGQVNSVSRNAPVLVDGMPAALLNDVFTITGCPFQVQTPAGTAPRPCVTAVWTEPAVRVVVSGLPALLATSTGVAMSAEQIPQGPVIVISAQSRVTAT